MKVGQLDTGLSQPSKAPMMHEYSEPGVSVRAESLLVIAARLSPGSVKLARILDLRSVFCQMLSSDWLACGCF